MLIPMMRRLIAPCRNVLAHTGSRLFALLLASCWLVAAPNGWSAEGKGDSFAQLADEYGRQTRPLVKKYCLDCHSTAKQEGELDLERFTTLDAIRRGTKVWLKVAEMLDNGEMPPKDAPRPSPDERQQ